MNRLRCRVILQLFYGEPQPFQIVFIGMRPSTVKVFNQHIEIRHGIRHAFHFDIALPDRLRHFSLTHILTDCEVAAANTLFCICEDFFEVLLVSAEARRSEKENLFASQL